MEVLNRALHVFRLVSADHYLKPVDEHQAIVARLGYGAGEQVADGLWADARELISGSDGQRRSRDLHPQAGLAAVLGGAGQPLASEELTLRARLDLDQGHGREAALQVMVALDAALAELSFDPAAPGSPTACPGCAAQREAAAAAAQSALGGELVGGPARAVVVRGLARLEGALRARAVAVAWRTR